MTRASWTSDFIVARLDEWREVLHASRDVRVWPSRDAHGILTTELGVLQALVDGRDPAEQVLTPVWRPRRGGPAIREEIPEPLALVNASSFLTHESEDAAFPQLLSVMPEALTTRLTKLEWLDGPAEQWAKECITHSDQPPSVETTKLVLNAAVELARAAVERGHTLYLWSHYQRESPHHPFGE